MTKQKVKQERDTSFETMLNSFFICIYGITFMSQNQLVQGSINQIFKQKKVLQGYVVDYISEWVSSDQLYYIKNCGNFLDFISDFSREKHKLVFANSCKNRFCPICNFRQSNKTALMINTVMKAIDFNCHYNYYFLTLTTPNVSGKDLEKEIKLFNAAISKLFRRKAILSISKGYIRKIEITYNKQNNTYNPHAHLILAVNKSYDKSSNYLSKSKWLDLWRSVTNKKGIDSSGRDEISQFHISPLKNKESAIFEVSKYAAKDFDLTYNKNVFDIFYKAFKGKQSLTFNGIFKQYVKKYKNNELDDYKIKDNTDYYWFIHSIFDFEDKLYKYEYKKLTNDQRRKFKLNAEIVE